MPPTRGAPVFEDEAGRDIADTPMADIDGAMWPPSMQLSRLNAPAKFWERVQLDRQDHVVAVEAVMLSGDRVERDSVDRSRPWVSPLLGRIRNDDLGDAASGLDLLFVGGWIENSHGLTPVWWAVSGLFPPRGV